VKRWSFSGLLAVLLLGLAGPAAAQVEVRVEAPGSPVALGSSFDVEIFANVMGDPVLAWGLDLDVVPALLSLQGSPVIDGVWNVPVTAPDGDGLAGAYFPPVGQSGLQGDLRLATLTFQAIAPGLASLDLSATASDLTEGFALDPSGFELDVAFLSAVVSIVPEPGTALLLGFGLAGLSVLARRQS
jgi:hypothetical protein